MELALLAIGNELLSGACLDTNSRALAKALSRKGHTLTKKIVCRDSEIRQGLETLLSECDIVITSGGLGPTHDDLTKGVLAEYFNVPLVKVKANLGEEHFRPSAYEKWQEESDLPEGAIPIPNRIGTAPGFMLEKNKKRVIAFPGVPLEFCDMLDLWLLPYLDKQKDPDEKLWFSTEVHFCHITEPELVNLASSLQRENPNMEIGVYPKLGTVSVVVRGKMASKKIFEEAVKPITQRLRHAFPTLVFPAEQGLIEEAIHKELIRRKETLALAESCSGGAMAQRLTKYAGASEYFLASFVTYSDLAKEKVLGVSKKTLEQKGAVSRDVVCQMIEGLFSSVDSDWALSISGVAGPTGGTLEKPVGTIWAAIAKKGKRVSAGLIPIDPGMDRAVNIEYSVTYLLSALWRKLAYNIEPFT